MVHLYIGKSNVMLKECKSIVCRNRNFSLRLNLTCGQTFRWRWLDDSTVIGVFSHRVWLLHQQNQKIYYKVLACLHWTLNCNISATDKTQPTKRKSDHVGNLFSSLQRANHENARNCCCQSNEETLLKDYLQSDVEWDKLLAHWTDKDRKFMKPGLKPHGIHVIRQDPYETLISFLCSVNNAIYRIVPMIDKMCTKFGKQLFQCDGIVLHDFPDVKTLSKSETVSNLRTLGFGYRADFIVKCAKEILAKGGDTWVTSLRMETYESAHEKLTNLPGVGHKVADCVCLMALDKPEAVPIDTHIRQIAARQYNHTISNKSLTPSAYKQLGGFFRTLWGQHAGWAQAELFVGEIKQSPELYAFFTDNTTKTKRKC